MGEFGNATKNSFSLSTLFRITLDLGDGVCDGRQDHLQPLTHRLGAAGKVDDKGVSPYAA
jgi:hypothetical protein